jgi:hypothetical protein
MVQVTISSFVMGMMLSPSRDTQFRDNSGLLSIVLPTVKAAACDKI